MILNTLDGDTVWTHSTHGQKRRARTSQQVVRLLRGPTTCPRNRPGLVYYPTITEEMVAHISRFAREIGALEGEVRHDELIATQFAALWKG